MISRHRHFLRLPRRLLALGSDILCTILSLLLAYFLRFNFSVPEEYFSQILISVPLLVFFRASSFFLFGLYRGGSRYASIDDMLRIIKSGTFGKAVKPASIMGAANLVAANI